MSTTASGDAARDSPSAPIEVRLAAAGLPPLPRLAWLEIDQDALAANLREVARLGGPDVEVAAVVKADGYGHGLEVAARTFVAAGAARLCVATLDEGLQLRGIGVDAPIIVLFPVPPESTPVAAAARLELVVGDEAGATEALRAWTGAMRDPGPARERASMLLLHLEIETGLSRGGVRPERAAVSARRIAETPGVRLVGVWSHLASPEDEQASAEQRRRLEAATSDLRLAGHPVPPRHLLGSGGLFAGSSPVLEMVRPGLALYGHLPAGLPITASTAASGRRLIPAMTLKARPVRVHEISAGEGVGYGGTWRADRPSRIATLPVGYGDGWVRGYAGRSSALVRGRRVPLVGTVAMDAVMADVTDVPGVGLTDEFVLLGRQQGEWIEASELARLRTTIVWEVLAGMAYRLPRVYHASALVTGMRTLRGEASASWVHPEGGEGPRTDRPLGDAPAAATRREAGAREPA